jgi:hypothetical protein
MVPGLSTALCATSARQHGQLVVVNRAAYSVFSRGRTGQPPAAP